MEIRSFYRFNLFEIGDGQIAAWDHLRRLCFELHLQIPTFSELRACDAQLREPETELRFYEEISARLDIPELEYPRFVILYDVDDPARERPLWVNLNVGYRLK